MPLQPDLMGMQMWSAFTYPTPSSLTYFTAIAKGVIKGIKDGVEVKAISTGLQGDPGTGKMIGLIGINANIMLRLLPVMLMSEGLMIPPEPVIMIDMITALAQMGDHIAVFTEIELEKQDAVALGVGMITPGLIMLDESVVAEGIQKELQSADPPKYTKDGSVIDVQVKISKGISKALKAAFLISSQVVPIIGGVIAPVPPVGPLPAAGTREGKFK